MGLKSSKHIQNALAAEIKKNVTVFLKIAEKTAKTLLQIFEV